MPAPAFSCDDELQGKVDEYLLEQRTQDRPLSLLGLAVFCGLEKQTIYAYHSGQYDDDGIEGFKFSPILRKLATQIELDLRDGALLGTRKEKFAASLLAMDYGYTYKPKEDASQQSKPLYVAYVGDDEAIEGEAVDAEFEEIEFVD